MKRKKSQLGLLQRVGLASSKDVTPALNCPRAPGPKATLKKTLFPVHRVTIIVASREAAKSFFFNVFFSQYRNDVENAEKKVNLGNVKKMYPFGTYKLTRPVDRKLNYF